MVSRTVISDSIEEIIKLDELEYPTVTTIENSHVSKISKKNAAEMILESKGVRDNKYSKSNIYPPATSAIDDLIPLELGWLEEYGRSNKWMNIKERILNSRNYQSTLRRDIQYAIQFIDFNQKKSKIHLESEFQLNDKREEIAISIIFEFLDEVVDTCVKDICIHLLSTSLSLQNILHKAVAKAISQTTHSNTRYLKMSGKQDILNGILSDIVKHKHFSNLTSYSTDTGSQLYYK